MVEPVSATGGVSEGTTTLEKSGFGRDAFLQLLVTKLKNQDPTNPAEDTEFIAQLAQFSALEQLIDINTAVTALSEQMAELSASQAPVVPQAPGLQQASFTEGEA